MKPGALFLLLAASAPVFAQLFPLTTLDGLDLINVKAQPKTYRGRPAVHILDSPTTEANMTIGRKNPSGEGLAILTKSDFEDGTIEVDLAGAPRTGASETARGFIGIAFHVQPDATHFECFYLRPSNGRDADQLRRNHSTQYISAPDFPWQLLRKEHPGEYESYVDLQPGEWTKVKIVVSGVDARLYVNNASQPCLLVHDLKLGKIRGRIALWAGQDTDGYFSNLRVTH